MIKTKKSLENIQPYATPKYAKICSLKLDSNESPYGPSPNVTKTLGELKETQVGLYPHYGELIDKVAQLYKVEDKNVLLSNGADEGLNVIINTFLEEDEELLCFIPTFSMPKLYTSACGAKFRGIDYYSRWVFDADKLIEQINDKTKLIYITSPNNPTGEMAKKEDVEKILQKFPDTGLILDTTYINFSLSDVNYFDLVKKYDNLIIVKSCSKDMGLAGLRLGIIISNENNITQFKKVISPYSVNAAAKYAAMAAISDSEYLKYVKEQNAAARELLIQGLNEMGFQPYKSDANFVLCDFKQYVDFVYKKLEMADIIVRKFSDETLKTCLRITVPKVCDIGIFFEALKKKDLLVFDLDGVVFDVSNSYRTAIQKTFEHFSKKELKQNEIQKAKEGGGLNCDWDLTKFLLEKHGFNVEFDEVKKIFQNMFFNPDKEGSKGLIDNEKLLISPETFEKLSNRYDFAVFTGRPKDEALYSLEKFKILKYFCKIITQDDLDSDKRKPHPEGLNTIKSCTVYNKVCYFGDTIDDIYSGVASMTTVYGVLPPSENNSKILLDAGGKDIVEDISKLDEFLEQKENSYANS